MRVSKWLKELEEYFFGSCVAYDNVRPRRRGPHTRDALLASLADRRFGALGCLGRAR